MSALRQAQDTIIEHSLDRISSAHDFYRTLPEDRATTIAAVARLGVTMFVDSAENPSTPLAPSQIFSVAPAALTGVITLEQTLALVRTSSTLLLTRLLAPCRRRIMTLSASSS